MWLEKVSSKPERGGKREEMNDFGGGGGRDIRERNITDCMVEHRAGCFLRFLSLVIPATGLPAFLPRFCIEKPMYETCCTIKEDQKLDFSGTETSNTFSFQPLNARTRVARCMCVKHPSDPANVLRKPIAEDCLHTGTFPRRLGQNVRPEIQRDWAHVSKQR